MCMHVYSFECFKAKFFIDKALELIDKYNVILFYIIFFFLGGGGVGYSLDYTKKLPKYISVWMNNLNWHIIRLFA